MPQSSCVGAQGGGDGEEVVMGGGWCGGDGEEAESSVVSIVTISTGDGECGEEGDGR